MKEQNPVNHVHFYAPDKLNHRFGLSKDKVSLLIPDTFSEHYLRVYCRKNEHVRVGMDYILLIISSQTLSDYGCP
jgi:hypothetical protein